MNLDHTGLSVGVMLGRVLELSERTADRLDRTATQVDTIEHRQAHVLPVVLHRLDRLERSAANPTPGSSTRPASSWRAAGSLLLACLVAAGGVIANLKPDTLAELIKLALRAGAG